MFPSLRSQRVPPHAASFFLPTRSYLHRAQRSPQPLPEARVEAVLPRTLGAVAAGGANCAYDGWISRSN